MSRAFRRIRNDAPSARDVLSSRLASTLSGLTFDEFAEFLKTLPPAQRAQALQFRYQSRSVAKRVQAQSSAVQAAIPSVGVF